MARKRANAALDVVLNGTVVGHLARTGAGAISFRYAPDWLSRDNALPISLSLPLSDETYRGDPVLFVIENLLPDNLDIRERIAAKTGAAGKDAYSILSVIGRDCIGAMQFLPKGTAPGDLALESEPISDARIADILRKLATAPLGMDDDDEAFRISIAGAQEKTALLWRDGAWHLPHGTTPTTHILKKPIGMRPDGVDLSLSVENEHFCMTFMRHLGMEVARTEIADFAGERALVVERFDRFIREDAKGKSILRLPQEDLCQALSVPSSKKYQKDGGPGFEPIMDLLLGSLVAQEDRRLMMKVMIVSWLLAASDGHAKNFSLRLLPEARYRLTPLYDVMSIQPLFDAGQIPDKKVRVAMAVGGKNHYIVSQITLRHFRETARKCKMPVDIIGTLVNELLEHSADALAATMGAMPADFPEEIGQSIMNGYLGRLELLGAMRAEGAT
jgi:serine/threonine-protein kinase HipA